MCRSPGFEGGLKGSGVKFADATSKNFVDGLSGKGFHLDGDSEVVFNKKDADFHELDKFTLGLALKKDTAGEDGTFVDFHRAMKMWVNTNDQVVFKLTTSDGTFTVTSGDTKLADTDWHKISVVYDDSAKSLSMWLDGTEVGQTEATGSTAAMKHWGLKLGANNWAGNTLKATVDEFAL